MEPLRMFARSESPTSVDVMDYFKEWLDELGIPSEITAVESGKLTGIILDGEFDVFEWGWYVEPDPDSILSYLTCDQLGNWSDSWYCNKEYDALYEQQHREVDEEARAEMVKQMQEILYLDAPYLVTAYSGIGEAYRSDRFTGFQPQPDPGGIWLMQYGVRNYLEIEPVSTSGSDTADGGGSMPLMVGSGIAAALVAGAGLMWVMRRRASAGERE
jgi:peptide/nickel transport system substrate-binding protein